MKFFEKPLSVWEKVSPYFIKPKMKHYVGWWRGGGFHSLKNWYDSILDVRVSDVSCKDKTMHRDDINFSFERPPQISVLLFRTFHVWLWWEPVTEKSQFCDESIYWETIYTMLSYNKSLFDAVNWNTWDGTKYVEDENGKKVKVKDKINAYTNGLLTERGTELYIQQLLEKAEENDENDEFFVNNC